MNAPPHNRLAVSLLLALAGIAFPAAAQTTVRMGVYQNSPKVGLSESGEPEGIFVDLIEAIAAAERWTIEYVPGTWAEGIDRLAAGKIDLMPDMAFSDERGKLFAFHREPVLSDWFEIYARRNGGIRALLGARDGASGHGGAAAAGYLSPQQEAATAARCAGSAGTPRGR